LASRPKGEGKKQRGLPIDGAWTNNRKKKAKTKGGKKLGRELGHSAIIKGSPDVRATTTENSSQEGKRKPRTWWGSVSFLGIAKKSGRGPGRNKSPLEKKRHENLLSAAQTPKWGGERKGEKTGKNGNQRMRKMWK